MCAVSEELRILSIRHSLFEELHKKLMSAEFLFVLFAVVGSCFAIQCDNVNEKKFSLDTDYPNEKEFDLIFVGLGSSSSIVLSKIVNNPMLQNLKILVLEAGPPLSMKVGGTDVLPYVYNFTEDCRDEFPTIVDIPGEYMNMAWFPEGAPYRLKEYSFGWQGMGWGGNSQFNGMLLQIPRKDEIDERWPAGWKYDDLSPYFDRVTEMAHSTQVPSKDGIPRNTGAYDATTPLFKSLGFKDMRVPQIQNSTDFFFGRPFVAADQGIRDGPVKSWLAPALSRVDASRVDLTIVSLAKVERLIFDETASQVIGVVFKQRNSTTDADPSIDPGLQRNATVAASGRVILGAGALASLRILYMSGVAANAEDQALVFKDYSKSIPKLVLQVPGIGKTWDHCGTSFGLRARNQAAKAFTSFYTSDYANQTDETKDYVRNRSGDYAIYGPVQLLRFTAQSIGDSELFFSSRGLGSEGGPFSGPHDVAGYVFLMDTKLRDRLSFTSDGTFKTPSVCYNSGPELKNDSDYDMESMVLALEKILNIFDKSDDFDIIFGPGAPSHPHITGMTRDDIRQYINEMEANGIYYSRLFINHYGGTIPLGTSVDTKSLLLNGTSNLHVIDASIMPQVSAAHPIATIMAMAEKIGEQLIQTLVLVK